MSIFILRATSRPHWWQWQSLLGLREEDLVPWTTPETTTVTYIRGMGAFSPHCLKGFGRKGKKLKHNKGFLASCWKPKAKAHSAIPASPYSKEEQQDAHRRAPMLRGCLRAPRETHFGLCSVALPGTATHMRLSPQSCTTHLWGLSELHFPFSHQEP